TIERAFFNLSCKVDNIEGIMPVTNSKPPNPRANMTSEIVNNILLIPPLVSNSLTDSKLVVASYPSNQTVHNPERDKLLVILASKVATILLIVKETKADILKMVQPIRTIIGIHDNGWIKPVSNNAALYKAIASPGKVSCGDKIVNKINEIIKAG